MSEVIVIGAGLTGLTLAYRLKRAGVDVKIVEQSDRVGGQIASHREGDFLFESGPNTGVVSCPEVAELFADLGASCTMEEASGSTKRRLIWCRGRLRPLPSSPWGGITTPLFTVGDKLRLLLEPWRAKGRNADESVADMVIRRMGRSFLDYAVDPFIGGIYAGDPSRLVTRYALPKLYNLEQTYGSFIRGAIAKRKIAKSERDKSATGHIYSVRGGLETLCRAMADHIGGDNIILSARNTVVTRTDDGLWRVSYDGGTVEAPRVVTTVGSYALRSLLPWAPHDIVTRIEQLEYAPVVQVSVGLSDACGCCGDAFGALIPSLRGFQTLGVLFPSACFNGRAPENGAMLSFFLGGMRSKECIDWDDRRIESFVTKELSTLLGIARRPDLIRIWRHRHAIPQYDATTGDRLDAIRQLEDSAPGLTIAGNMRDGIGMPDRIRQASQLAARIIMDTNRS